MAINTFVANLITLIKISKENHGRDRFLYKEEPPE
jgi:hypothetical protein